jgi:hypothetical protein
MKLKARNLTIRMKGEDVKLLQDQLQKSGFVIPSGEKKKGYFGSGTRKAVLAFQKKNRLTATGVVDDKTAAKLMSAVKEPAYSVEGTVKDSSGNPCQGLIVKAFDRNISADDTLLGQATTHAEGNYSISYTLKQLSGKTAADLVICMYQGDELLQTSDVIFNARTMESRDLIITIKKESDFHYLSSRIQPLLREKTKIARLAQTQITFLSEKTGLDTRHIEWLVKSNQLAGQNKKLAIFFFGLLSQNLPTDFSVLLNWSRESIDQALSRAAAANLIPSLNPADIDNIIKKVLPELLADKLLQPAVAGKPALLGDLLRTMPRPLTDGCLRKVADIVGQSGIEYGKLPDQLRSAGLSRQQAIGVERSLRLADLTLRNACLMQHLQDITQDDVDASLKSLAKIQLDQWIDKAYQFGLPAESSLSPEVYAKQLALTVEELHPTATLAARFSDGLVPLYQPGFEKVGSFINNNPAFDILKTDIPEFIKTANLKGIEDKSRLSAHLLICQRLKKLKISWDEAFILCSAGNSNH